MDEDCSSRGLVMHEIYEYEAGDYLLLSRNGDVLAVSGNSEFDDVDNPPTESGMIVLVIENGEED